MTFKNIRYVRESADPGLDFRLRYAKSQLKASHPSTRFDRANSSIQGTNLQALIDACNNSSLLGQIVRVISNRKDAYGLTRAQKSTPPIPTLVHSLYKYKKRNPEDVPLAREQYDEKLASLVLEDEPDTVVCACSTLMD